MRVEPLGGATALVAAISFTAPSHATHDRFRDRIVVPQNNALTFVDELGATQVSAPFPPEFGGALGRLAPTGDGRIYMVFRDKPVLYLDSAGSWQTLLDIDGTTPFVLGSLSDFGAAIFDANEDALLVLGPGSGADVGKTIVRRLALSQDGTKLLNPVAAVVQDLVDGSEVVGGLTAAPNGMAMLSVDDNSNTEQPRFWLLDPATLALSVHTTNEHFGVGAQSSGGWSEVLGRAVALNTLTDQIRAYEAPEGGEGIVIASGVSSAGGSAESTRLLVIGGMTIGTPGSPGDLNGDGVVDGADLGLVLSEWGPCPGCASDLNGDGIVDGADLGLLLAEWGS